MRRMREFTMWHQSIAFFVRTSKTSVVGGSKGCQRICALTIQMTRLRVQNRCQKSLQYTQGRREKNLDSGWQKPICEIDVNPFFWLWENGEVTLNSLLVFPFDFLQKTRKVHKNGQMVFMYHVFDFVDFERFSCYEKL